MRASTFYKKLRIIVNNCVVANLTDSY